jgi:murein DD-endopeptidase MepM/ murein hydrolase activator NlpD
VSTRPIRSSLLVPLAAAATALVLVTTSPAGALPCLAPPVAAPASQPFQGPACTWCPGHRGLTYATGPGTVVRSAGAGSVSFAGPVAGKAWVTVAHDGGLLTSYGPMRQLLVRRGALVESGAVLGTAAGPLHFGVRVGGQYVDPAPMLGHAVHLVPRLVPLRGRIPPPPAPRCPAGGTKAPVR